MFTGDLQPLVGVQGHQVQQGGQAVHPAQQYHHPVGGTQDAGQEGAPPLAEALQHPLAEDQQLAAVAGQPGAVAPVGHRCEVIAADPVLRDWTGEHGLKVGRPLLRLCLIDD